MDRVIRVKRTKHHLITNKWIWRFAWHDARKNLPRLIWFISSIIIGIAALVAIHSFIYNLRNDVDNQAKALLGADLVLYSDKNFEGDAFTLLDSLQQEQASDARFSSMVAFPHNGESRIAQIVAIEGSYPFYGEMLTLPEHAIDSFRLVGEALLDDNMAFEYEVSTGDTLQIGELKLRIAGIVTKIPGNVKIAGTFAPSVYIPLDSLAATGLTGKGSRINYRKYFKNTTTSTAEQLLNKLRAVINKTGLGYETVAYRKESLGSGFENLNRFFNLLGFMALILGSAGVASSVHIYSKEKVPTIAILRCLGASGKIAFQVVFLQIAMIGFIGSVAGALLGHYIQLIIPFVLEDFLPVALDFDVSWRALGEGIFIGFTITMLFALFPLVGIKFIPPLAVLRSDVSNEPGESKARRKVIFFIILFCWFFALLQTGNFKIGSIFFICFLLSLLLFGLVAFVLVYGLRKFFPYRAHFIFRQSLANLFRPNNQTVVLILVIGLGAFLISTVSIVQNGILQQIAKVSAGTKSNMVLYDVQPDQKKEVLKMVEDFGIKKNNDVPIVMLRLHKIKGRSINEIKSDDSEESIPDWLLYMEHLATYRNDLIDSEEITTGILLDSVRIKEDTVYISITETIAEQLHLNVGDEVIFNVHGLAIETYVGSIRKVEWQQLHTNFAFLFPIGVLEETPHFYALLLHAPSTFINARFKQRLAEKAPNISTVDLSLMLKTVDEVMEKVAFALKFMAMFCVVTGLMVLAGSVVNSKFMKMKESSLLRTIGALRRQLLGIAILEYAYLGCFAGICGILLSLLASWALTSYFLDLVFVPKLSDMAFILFTIILLTITVGSINLREILNRSPLEVLRKEG
ncbi:MAG: FtsX-like permease family protein [Bacteroidota bacterium]